MTSEVHDVCKKARDEKKLRGFTVTCYFGFTKATMFANLVGTMMPAAGSVRGPACGTHALPPVLSVCRRGAGLRLLPSGVKGVEFLLRAKAVCARARRDARGGTLRRASRLEGQGQQHPMWVGALAPPSRAVRSPAARAASFTAN